MWKQSSLVVSLLNVWVEESGENGDSLQRRKPSCKNQIHSRATTKNTQIYLITQTLVLIRDCAAAEETIFSTTEARTPKRKFEIFHHSVANFILWKLSLFCCWQLRCRPCLLSGRFWYEAVDVQSPFLLPSTVYSRRQNIFISDISALCCRKPARANQSVALKCRYGDAKVETRGNEYPRHTHSESCGKRDEGCEDTTGRDEGKYFSSLQNRFRILRKTIDNISSRAEAKWQVKVFYDNKIFIYCTAQSHGSGKLVMLVEINFSAFNRSLCQFCSSAVEC